MRETAVNGYKVDAFMFYRNTCLNLGRCSASAARDRFSLCVIENTRHRTQWETHQKWLQRDILLSRARALYWLSRRSVQAVAAAAPRPRVQVQLPAPVP